MFGALLVFRKRRANAADLRAVRRLGDKFLEADRIGPAALSTTPSPPPPDASSPGLTDELVTSYYAAAVHSVNSLLSLPTSLPASSSVSSRTRTEADRIRALFSLSTPWARLAFDGGDDAARPTLALMSDDSNAVEAFRAHPMARRFRIVGTAEVGAASSSSPDVDHRVKRDVQQAVMQKRRPEFDVDGAGHAGHGQVGGTVGHGRMQTVPKVKADVPDGFVRSAFFAHASGSRGHTRWMLTLRRVSHRTKRSSIASPSPPASTLLASSSAT